MTAVKTKKFITKGNSGVKEAAAGYVFMAPLILGMLIFTLYPVIMSLWYSLNEFNLFKDPVFLGLDNFVKIFTNDSETVKVIGNTFIFAAISIPVSLLLSYMLALLVSRSRKGVKAFRLLYYLPVVIPGVVSGVIWKDMLNPSHGAMNTIFSALGLRPNTFFSQPSTSMFAVIFMGLWGLGGSMIMWLAALKNIPDVYYEAADIDGASALTKLFRITVPMSTSMIFYNLVTGVIGALQVNATLIYAPREGRGYDNAVYFIGVKIYREAFVRWNMGYAAAIAWVLFIIIGLLTLLIFKTSKWVYYGDGE